MPGGKLTTGRPESRRSPGCFRPPARCCAMTPIIAARSACSRERPHPARDLGDLRYARPSSTPVIAAGVSAPLVGVVGNAHAPSAEHTEFA